MLLVDAANVVGSRPTGWWRDRAGAAGKLVDNIRAAVAAAKLAPPVVVVLEGAARRGATDGEDGGVTVVHAPGEGDETVVSVAEAATDAVTLVSADRALADQCRALGCDVVGPRWLLDRLSASLPSNP